MKKQFENNRQLILYFIKGSKTYFILAILFAAAASFFDLINPRIISFTVDSVIGSKKASLPAFFNGFIQGVGGITYLKGHIYLIGVFVVIVAIIGALFRYLFRLFNSKGAEKFVKVMRDGLFEHIVHLPFAWFTHNPTGDIIQRCTSDVETIKRFLSEQLTQMLRIIIMIVLSLYFMSTISIKMMLAAAIFIPIIVTYSLFFHKRIGATFEKADEEEGVLSSIAQENLTGVRVVRAFGRERYERQRFEKQNTIYTKAFMKLDILITWFWSIGDGISGLQLLTIAALGAYFGVKGDITAGDYIAFVSYNTMLVWPIRSLGRVISDMSRASVSIDRIRYIMNSDEEEDDKDAINVDMHGDIVFDHVSFRYNDDGPLVLDDISFAIEKGTTLGILGGTGSGKSTLMYLLDHLYEVSSGHIYINGVDIKHINRDYLRKNIGLVLQEPYLFSKSIEENIAIGIHSATMDDVEEASKIASLNEAINHFKNGYKTSVGERGVTLSGGQKQRTAIAQMVIRKTPIMIFDDSLSAVDSETDMKIRRALEENIHDATVILISHRITTLMQADQIIVLNKGRIAEVGNHQQLRSQKGIYRKICDIQNIGEDNS